MERLVPFSGVGLAASACRSTAAKWFVPFSDAGLAALMFRSSRAGWLVLLLGAGLAAPVCRVPDLRLRCLGDLSGGPFSPSSLSPAPVQLILLKAQVGGSLLILPLAWLPCSCTTSPRLRLYGERPALLLLAPLATWHPNDAGADIPHAQTLLTTACRSERFGDRPSWWCQAVEPADDRRGNGHPRPVPPTSSPWRHCPSLLVAPPPGRPAVFTGDAQL